MNLKDFLWYWLKFRVMELYLLPMIFPAIYNIIDDKKNDLIVSCKGRFDVAVMAEAVGGLMKDERKRKEMFNAAYKHSKDFTIDTIYKNGWNY